QAANRDLTEGENERFNRLTRGIEKIDDEIRGLVRQLAGQPGHAESGDGATGAPELMQRVDPWTRDDVRHLPRAQVRDKARKALEDRRLVEHLEARQLESLDRLLRTQTDDCDGGHIAQMLLLSETPEYRSAFRELVSKSQPILDHDQVQAVRRFNDFRAMSIGSDAAGGFGVPVLIDPTVIMTAQGSPNDILSIARVETITTDEWKGVSSAGMSWSFDAEAAEVSDDSPTLAQPTVPTYKAQGFIPFSIEVGMDYPNFAAEMSTLLSEGYSELLAGKLTTGSGSDEPTGIVTALDADTTSEVAVTTDGAFGAVDLYKLWAALPARFRRRPDTAWMSSTDVMNEVRNFGTTMGSNFTVDLTDESIPRLMNRRYYENDFLPDFTATTGAANLMVLGSWAHFLVAQRAGMQVELVPHLLGSNRRPSGQRGWYAWARVGSNVTTTAAFKLLQNQ
ncbi:MAG TPA: phage major capsid protein, partial [Amycolatopsis sp.]|nr:phage major capsid protein [Amycolatopsis sp.]